MNDPVTRLQELPHLSLFRTVFALRSPLPVTDGLSVVERITDEPRLEGGDIVYLRFHEVWTSESGLSASLSAESQVLHGLKLGTNEESAASVSPKGEGTLFRHTVVDAVTAETFAGEARNARPSEDSVMRILQALSEVARAFRLAGVPAVEVPTYESLPPMLLTWRATGVGTSEGFAFSEDASWIPSLMMMETLTASPDYVYQPLAPAPGGDTEQRARQWMYALRTNDPLTRSLEWLRRAEHSLWITGSYTDAVLHASTAGEVLTDGLLSALLWEEHFQDPSKPGPSDVAAIFVEGQGKSRATSYLCTRLGGDWNSPVSPWKVWNERAGKQRNRVIHGGYSPTRAEAETAVQASFDLQTWLCDRLSEKRTTYPRVTITMLGRSGLAKRNAWNGKIKRFAEIEADAEAHWGTTFAQWHADLVANI